MKKFARRQFLHLATVAGTLAAISRATGGQVYPDRPVRMVVPYAPGGPTDVITRLLAQKLSERQGKQFYVENMGGGGGNIAMGRVARMAPDGYTLLMVNPSYVVNPTLYGKVPYDLEKDFDLVSLAALTTLVITVHPTVPAHTVKDLVAIIKSNPGKYSYASAGAGTQSHLAGEQFRLSLGLDLVHVPFSGGGPAIASVIAGHTPVGFNSPTTTVQHIKDGKVRALGVTGASRSQSMPDVPTMTEGGYPDIKGDSWVGFLVPAGTPKDIVVLLNREIAKILALPDMKDRLVSLGSDAVASSPEEFAQRIKTEIETWGKVIRAANIKVQ